MRWEHKFEVCSGDLIPAGYYAQMEQYEYQIPNFYFLKTGYFMRIYSLMYVGTFSILVFLGLLISLYVTYRTTIKDDRLPFDPTIEEIELKTEETSIGQVLQEPYDPD